MKEYMKRLHEKLLKTKKRYVIIERPAQHAGQVVDRLEGEGYKVAVGRDGYCIMW